jgi:predicted O-methyltransferase YrrM
MDEDPSVTSALRHLSVDGVLQRLRSEGRQYDAEAKRRLADARDRSSAPVGVMERAEMCVQAPIAVSDEVGRLLYTFARARAPQLAVEFGCSLGVSTIYVAAALADNGHGRLITAEIHPGKARAAETNLEQAGLDHLVEVRVGDALHTLNEIAERVDLLILDGWNELYLPVLDLLMPQLASGAFVVADLSADDPDLLPYLERVRDPDGEWTSLTIPLDAGVEISTWGRGSR